MNDVTVVNSPVEDLYSNNGKRIKDRSRLPDDIIELNVGGQKMSTLRSTLTAVPNSRLALIFSNDNSKQGLQIDKQGAVFFDYNPMYFNYLLDQLRAIKRTPKLSRYQLQFSSPFVGTHVNFTHMLVDFGLTCKLKILRYRCTAIAVPTSW